MKSFSTFLLTERINEETDALLESLDVEKLTHLEHAEDSFVTNGDEGILHASEVMDDLDRLLSGEESKAVVRTKMDGSPSTVFGINPEVGFQ
jgi:hypothetical protein